MPVNIADQYQEANSLAWVKQKAAMAGSGSFAKCLWVDSPDLSEVDCNDTPLEQAAIQLVFPFVCLVAMQCSQMGGSMDRSTGIPIAKDFLAIQIIEA